MVFHSSPLAGIQERPYRYPGWSPLHHSGGNFVTHRTTYVHQLWSVRTNMLMNPSCPKLRAREQRLLKKISQQNWD